MQLEDPFPVSSCTRRLRVAILAKFGRCPTVQEVIEVPDAHWLKVPGVGTFALQELQHIKQGLLECAECPFGDLTSEELVFERDKLKHEINLLRSNLQGITLELLSRGLAIPGLRPTRQ
jgi:hypothetical protein